MQYIVFKFCISLNPQHLSLLLCQSFFQDYHGINVTVGCTHYFYREESDSLPLYTQNTLHLYTYRQVYIVSQFLTKIFNKINARWHNSRVDCEQCFPCECTIISNCPVVVLLKYCFLLLLMFGVTCLLSLHFFRQFIGPCSCSCISSNAAERC